MIDPSVFSWTIYGFALYYWWMIFQALRTTTAEDLVVHPSFLIVGMMSTIFTVVNFTQSVWGHVIAQIQ